MYSFQKNTNLFRHMICSLLDWFIYDIFPPNAATINDATLMNIIRRADKFAFFSIQRWNQYPTRNWASEWFPHWVNQELYQMNTNWLFLSLYSITKVRSIVETVFGRVNSEFRITAGVLCGLSLLKFIAQLKILRAIINRYYPRVIDDEEHQSEICQESQAE